ncbi:hypothetical protein [Nonomuraea africana]|uniref:Uncharacterized protein n=1 Tax=Nonomuraea africana TaxID=46171 RepID=A0ABR9K9Y2_9ACTN|nr:hypothetical protein [Nonomuraea africana]MBE1558813.1 hypothetical protein [Nonomuraea africana]
MICNKVVGKPHFSNMDIAFDRQEQLQQIQSGLLPGEQVIAVHNVILHYLKRSPRTNTGDSSRPNRAATRTVATLLLGGSPSGPTVRVSTPQPAIPFWVTQTPPSRR